MKAQKSISKFFTLAICGLMLVGCQPKDGGLPTEQSQQENQQKEPSDKLNLLDLQSDRKVIPLENPKHGNIVGSAVLIDVEPEQQDSVYSFIKDIPDEIDSLNSQAYRVQIFSSKKFGESSREKTVAEEIFDRPVFLDYEVPYYKIRVGNFPNREKAEEYQQRVKMSGYKNAWIVVVTINIKETSPMYDELIIPEILDSLYLDLEDDQKENESDDSE